MAKRSLPAAAGFVTSAVGFESRLFREPSECRMAHFLSASEQSGETDSPHFALGRATTDNRQSPHTF
ncbi:hypothetical protein Ddc_05790 [Ditylenchus destructor]|nr:hypothetical protein Ddc_05790 [Ditylenchus destructor]